MAQCIDIVFLLMLYTCVVSTPHTLSLSLDLAETIFVIVYIIRKVYDLNKLSKNLQF
jgi:hypothetical protein